MKIIITLAGQSRRFKEKGYSLPKFLLPLADDRTMIEHVVDMFAPAEKFVFIVNQMQIEEFPTLRRFLTSLAPSAIVQTIAVHEIGPTFSALQAPLEDDEEVIVSYCDFLLDWNFTAFTRFASQFDAAMPTFRGFHPASFGDTYYAYCRTNGPDLLELREKRSFTSKRHLEPASAGVYYFAKASLLKKYGQEIVDQGAERELKEAYTSLLMNPILRDGGTVGIQDVKRFICLGTPHDYRQYRFWESVFCTQPQNALQKDEPHQVNLIPMAGRGARFKDHGYRVIKPLIQINNQPMILRACESFPRAKHWVFLPLEAEAKKHPILETIREVYPNAQSVPVRSITSGQAATCLLAKEEIKPNAPLYIASCDYELRFDPSVWSRVQNDESIDIAVFTTKLQSQLVRNYDAFAYCKLTDEVTIAEIIEKKQISSTPEEDQMVVGSFWYRKGSDFIRSAEEMIEDNERVSGEHYVATSINRLLKEGKRAVIFEVDQWISFGDPFELQVYEYWQDHFEERKNSSRTILAKKNRHDFERSSELDIQKGSEEIL